MNTRLLVAALGLSLLFAPRPAQAAFPGGNGRIAFESYRDGAFEIYSMNPDGSDQKRLTTGGGESPAWSATGTKIAFRRGAALWVMDADGANAHQVGTNVQGDDPSWSPDGAQIAYAGPGDVVWVVNSDGTNPHALPATGSQRRPAWSPDGTKIAFVGPGGRSIWVMAADGSNPTPLTTPGEHNIDKAPNWSPDGLTVAFTRDYDDGSNETAMEDDVHVVAASGGQVTNLMSNHPRRDTTPAWAPDGSQIVHETSLVGEQTQVATLGSSGGTSFVATSASINQEPDWQPKPCAEVKIGSAVAQGCFAEVADHPGDFTTDQDAWIGGFHIRPRPTGSLVLHTAGSAPTLAAEGAGVDVLFLGVATPMPVGVIPVGSSSASIDVGGIGTLEQAMFNLPLAGSFKVEWAPDGRSSTIELGVTIKDRLIKTFGSLAPADEAKLDGTLKATQANGNGLKVDSASLTIPDYNLTLPAGQYAVLPSSPPTKIGLAGVTATAERVDDKWRFTGAGAVKFPFRGQEITLGGSVTVFDGALTGLGIKVGGFNTPLGQTGLFLQDVDGLTVWSPKFGLDLGATATLGPKPPGTDEKLVELEGRVRILDSVSSCPKPATWAELALSGNIVALERGGYGEGKLEGVSCLVGDVWVQKGTIDISVKVGETEDVAGAKGAFEGWLGDSSAMLKGNVTIQLPLMPDFGGTGVVSDAGYAFCANLGSIFPTIPSFQGGFGSSWTLGSQLFTGCDLSPWETSAAASAAGSSARKVRVPRGLPLVAFAAVGAKRAPHVRITAPGGRSFTTGAASVRRRDRLILPADAARRTYVLIPRPRAGVWRIAPLAHEKLRKVECARGLPKPKVKAKVRRVKGKWRLTYRVRRIAGKIVQFVERTKEGGAQTLGRPTKRRRGTIRFKPSASPTRRHTIEASVVQNRLPRARVRAGTFRTPAGG